MPAADSSQSLFRYGFRRRVANYVCIQFRRYLFCAATCVCAHAVDEVVLRHFSGINLVERGFIFIGIFFAFNNLMANFANEMFRMLFYIARRVTSINLFKHMFAVNYGVGKRLLARRVLKSIFANRTLIIFHVSVHETRRFLGFVVLHRMQSRVGGDDNRLVLHLFIIDKVIAAIETFLICYIAVRGTSCRNRFSVYTSMLVYGSFVPGAGGCKSRRAKTENAYCTE